MPIVSSTHAFTLHRDPAIVKRGPLRTPAVAGIRFYCVYPGGCATDADCSGGLSCVPQADGSTSCDMAACPV